MHFPRRFAIEDSGALSLARAVRATIGAPRVDKINTTAVSRNANHEGVALPVRRCMGNFD